MIILQLLNPNGSPSASPISNMNLALARSRGTTGSFHFTRRQFKLIATTNLGHVAANCPPWASGYLFSVFSVLDWGWGWGSDSGSAKDWDARCSFRFTLDRPNKAKTSRSVGQINNNCIDWEQQCSSKRSMMRIVMLPRFWQEIKGHTECRLFSICLLRRY